MADRPTPGELEARAARPIGLERRGWARLASERPEIAALVVRERAHTLRTIISALAIVALAGCLIPIATARPRYRPTPR